MSMLKTCDRKASHATKWCRYNQKQHHGDVIPLWVADMDFMSAPAIIEALTKRAQHGDFGYTDVDEDVYQAIIDWQLKHHVKTDKNSISFATSIKDSVRLLINHHTQPNDGILVFTPIYPPLYAIGQTLNRQVFDIAVDPSGRIDFKQLQRQLDSHPEITLFILCNPHNPTGNFWDKNDLMELVTLCNKHHITIISDEVHADVTIHPQRFTSILALDTVDTSNCIVVSAPSKAFNIAGLKVSYVIFNNQQYKQQFDIQAKFEGISSINLFGYEALKAAYNDSEQWLINCNQYIYDNLVFVKDYLNQHLPKAHYQVPEATYLAWINLNQYNLPNDFSEKLLCEAGVHIEVGDKFWIKTPLPNWIRLNVACPKPLLEEGLQRLCHYVLSLQ